MKKNKILTTLAACSIILSTMAPAFFVGCSSSESEDKASISRDDKEVWFIKGGSFDEVFKGMGYAVATDRLWQLELHRRAGRGTMAEVFGPSLLTIDIYARTTGYSDTELQTGFDQLDKDSHNAVQAYVDGINQRIEEIKADPSQLPFEFATYGKQIGAAFFPKPWTPGDVLAVMAALQSFRCRGPSHGPNPDRRLTAGITC
ncbi:MAG: penicillin acylase family protein [Deltaproteobacteria bacterium]|nr:penicillin acylase family protein [Deltaproteobacteria bacterium]